MRLMLTLIFLPKRALKEVSRGPHKNEAKPQIKGRKIANRADPTGAWPCHRAQATVHRCTAVRLAHTAVHLAHDWSCTGGAGFCSLCLGCTAVHPCVTPVRFPVFLCFAILGARSFLEPLIFLEIAWEVLFFIET